MQASLDEVSTVAWSANEALDLNHCLHFCVAGEFVRLVSLIIVGSGLDKNVPDYASHLPQQAFEYAKHPYKQDLKPENFMKYIKDPSSTPSGAPHAFAPPMLEHKGNVITQTPNILLYIGHELKLTGNQPMDKFYVNELTLTILDLNNEIHDSVSTLRRLLCIPAEPLHSITYMFS